MAAYLDNAATTPIHSRVLDDMMPFFQGSYGNPSSIHRQGRLAGIAVEKARKQVAAIINASPKEIFFTSGATESNNIAIHGSVSSRSGKHIVTTSIEHDAVLETCKSLEKKGYEITYLPVNRDGIISAESVEKEVSKDTVLVTVMYANNEIGTLQPIKEISYITRQKNVLFHSDAVQALGKVNIDTNEQKVDLLSISSHKINGPKGVGALFVRKNAIIPQPLIYGGGQERGLRSGTENVPGIVGFGKACELAKENFSHNSLHMKRLRDKLAFRILQEIPHTSINGHPEKRVPNNLNITFRGVNGEDLIIKLDENSIAASTGSACSVRVQKESHVLKAMGLSHDEISGSLRLSTGIMNTEEEIDKTVDVLKTQVSELRKLSPHKEKYNY